MAVESVRTPHVTRAERLWQQAVAAFGTRSGAARWFRSPALGLEQRRPIDLLWTEEGIGRVEVLINRLDHGVYT